ncbi:MAG: hypothetical protein AABX89_08155 [Candidatus Thermoplasmatota archaeon]
MAAKRSAKPARKPVKKVAAKRPVAKKTAAASTRKVQPGFVSHTEFASTNQAATKAWASKVLGWEFGPDVQLPGGIVYPMWRHSTGTGGGIRGTNPGEPGGTTPYVETKDIVASVDAAKKHGATVMMPIDQVPGGGRIAIVMAPGNVPIGFWSP